ncbi:MAG: hypothetical protein DRP35_06955 [Candidatus Zixiibacteriota bacterium]|nr:MAG: hypothetical protein DRP35_06955 [candidate division Zixibacteria bacterium]
MPIYISVNTIKFYILAGIIITFLLTTNAIARVSEDSTLIKLDDYRVNNDNTVTVQNNPKVAVSGDRSFIISWVDRRNGNADIYMQKFNSDANPIGNNVRINDDNSSSYQTNPDIGIDLFGRYSLTWLDYRDGTYPVSPNIYFQGFDSSANFSGSNISLTDIQQESIKEAPSISFSNTGDGVAVWADYRNNNWDIIGQRFNYDGTLIGSNFYVNDDSVFAQQHAPKVSMAPSGWFVVTWYDNRNDNEDVYVQCYDEFAVKIGGNLLVNEDTLGFRQTFPDVAADGSGNFTVVWTDWRNGEYPDNPDIYSKKYDTLLIALTEETLLNNDSGSLAQKEPTIASDRMGNVAIIWSDSTASSWDITGQMIDVDGIVQEENFQANSFGDSTQFDPDVALDGIFRYIVWTDNRNGDFDIYTSVTKYNDPTLIASPENIQFQMPVGGPLPHQVAVEINHGGYNNLGFTIEGEADWLNVFPVQGQTPDTIFLSVNSDTLPFGKYQTILTMVDTLNNDSSSVILVELDVTSPVLHLSEDSLFFSTVYGVASNNIATVDISNIGSGEINWASQIDSSWITISENSATAPSTVQISVEHLGLDSGLYVGEIIINAPGAGESPQTIYVEMEVLPNHPIISVNPDSIYAQIINRNLPNLSFEITNTGNGQLNWVAVTDDSWLYLNRNQGSDDVTINLNIDSLGLISGLNRTFIRVIDTASVNDSVLIPVVIDWIEVGKIEATPDSFYIYSTTNSFFDSFTVIQNLGYGNLNWTATENELWLDIIQSGNSENDSLYISINDPSLQYGVYTAFIEIRDATAVNSPYIIPFTYYYHQQPQISIFPNEFNLTVDSSEVLDTFLVVGNNGIGNLDWSAISNVSYIELNPMFGSDDDTLWIHLENNLPVRNYSDIIRIIDDNAINSPYTVPFVLNVNHNPKVRDTVIIETVEIYPGLSGNININLEVNHDFKHIHLPLNFESDKVQIDSVIKSSELPSFSFINYNINNMTNAVVIDLLSNNNDSVFLSTNGQLCQIYFSSFEFAGISLISSEVANDSAYLIDEFDYSIQLDVIPGGVKSNIPTDIDDIMNGDLPSQFKLCQNYPNPFNSETSIKFEIPKSTYVNLSIYNILGQKVVTLVDEILKIGSYSINWQSSNNSGFQVPSGIYFYKIRTDYNQSVKKMVLIK